MKKLLRKRVILNVLSVIALAAHSDLSAGCALFLFDPQKPEALSKVSKKDLFVKKNS